MQQVAEQCEAPCPPETTAWIRNVLIFLETVIGLRGCWNLIDVIWWNHKYIFQKCGFNVCRSRSEAIETHKYCFKYRINGITHFCRMLHNIQRCRDFKRFRWEKGAEAHLLGATTWEESWRSEAVMVQNSSPPPPISVSALNDTTAHLLKRVKSIKKGSGLLSGELALASM